MSQIYLILKQLLPRQLRTFLRDLDSAYHKLEYELATLKQKNEQKDVEYQKLYNSYQSLQNHYQSLQNSYQEINNLYEILGNSHKRLLKHIDKKISVITEKPVAYDSPDHIEPWGTKQDNSINLNFNYKLAKWIPIEDLTVLDLGCAGGGFVKSIIDLGYFAVGIEGSDYSKIKGRAEWSTIPNNLFTSDITEPFKILVQSNKEEVLQLFQFKVITAWEFIEHIRPEQLKNVFQNISTHLQKDGVVIMSVSPNEDVVNSVRLHQTVENKEWWLAECFRNGFVHHEEVVKYFGRDFVREESNAPNSFHSILTRKDESLPVLNFNN